MANERVQALYIYSHIINRCTEWWMLAAFSHSFNIYQLNDVINIRDVFYVLISKNAFTLAFLRKSSRWWVALILFDYCIEWTWCKVDAIFFSVRVNFISVHKYSDCIHKLINQYVDGTWMRFIRIASHVIQYSL